MGRNGPLQRRIEEPLGLEPGAQLLEGELEGAEPPPPEMVPEASGELEFKVSGDAAAEIDLTNGKLQYTNLKLRIDLSGTAQVASGKSGKLAGSVTLTEKQKLKTD